jgi:FAD/FMN-containing dehydrogenase
MGRLYSEAGRRKKVVVGGMDYDVSIGGYMLAGGHSPLSTMYGLAADQLLEAEIITPTGEALTVNKCQNQDLFWAIRGVSTSNNLCAISHNIRAALPSV